MRYLIAKLFGYELARVQYGDSYHLRLVRGTAPNKYVHIMCGLLQFYSTCTDDSRRYPHWIWIIKHD